MVLIAYVFSHSFKHIQLSRMYKDLVLGLYLGIFLYFVSASQEGSGETAQMRSLT